MAAMDEELHRIVALLENVTTEKVARKTVYRGQLGQQSVVVVFSGWGKVASASTATMLIERYQISALIFTGVAGAVAKPLNIGDIVVGHSFVQHDMDCAGVLGIQRFEIPLLSRVEIPATASLMKLALDASHDFLEHDIDKSVSKDALKALKITTPTVHKGLIASGDQFISSAEQQQALLGALPNLLAVEMEGAAIAQVAYEYRLPFAVIRIISDKADQHSTIDFPKFIDEVASHFTAGIIKQLVPKINKTTLSVI